uniref:Uncharacterized protein n=1 Tax=Cucumis melo TaxID=3656 RepID=A0A9I9E9X6_CUCME
MCFVLEFGEKRGRFERKENLITAIVRRLRIAISDRAGPHCPSLFVIYRSQSLSSLVCTVASTVSQEILHVIPHVVHPLICIY